MLKRLTRCVREFKVPAILACLLVVLECVMEVVTPLVMARIIDKGVDAGNMSAIWKYAGLLILTMLMSVALGSASAFFSAKAVNGFSRNLRHDVYYRVQQFSFNNIDQFSTASLVTRLTTDVSNVQNAFMQVLNGVRGPLMMVFSLVMAYIISPKLSIIFLCMMPVLGGLLMLIAWKVHPVFERVFRTYDKLNNVVQENIRGIRVVKSFVRADYEVEKFTKVSGSIYQDFAKAERINALNRPIMQVCMNAVTILVAWIGARLIVANQMTTGELMSLISYGSQMLMSMMMLSMMFTMLIISWASMKRVDAVLCTESDLTNGPDPVMAVPDGSIEFDHVTFRYAKRADKPVLDDVTLSIRSGETVGIIGGTGSAKSSLIQLVSRLYDVNEGSVKVGGLDVRDYDIKTLRDAVSVVLQKNVLFTGTIRDNLRWGDQNATEEQMVHACQVAQADGFIRSFPDGYDTRIEQDGANVSGGQRQRLCIARALLKNPKILILDDSTSAVDTATDALIREAFRKEMPNVTKLIVAQRIASVADADHILVLDDGHVDGFGTHEELLKSNKIYQEVYYSQLQKGGADHAARQNA